MATHLFYDLGTCSHVYSLQETELYKHAPPQPLLCAFLCMPACDWICTFQIKDLQAKAFLPLLQTMLVEP